MPFAAGNTIWQDALAARNRNKDDLAYLIHDLVEGGYLQYSEKMYRLASGQSVSKAEQQFMDRIERHLEFALPKLARQEHTGKDGTPLTLSVVHYGNLPVLQDDTAIKVIEGGIVSETENKGLKTEANAINPDTETQKEVAPPLGGQSHITLSHTDTKEKKVKRRKGKVEMVMLAS